MKRMRTGLLALCLSLGVVALGASRLHVSAPAPAAEAEAAPPSCAREDRDALLFPGLTSAQITSISVVTQGGSFEFCRDSRGAVSVNGQRADGEVYLTLVDQITHMPVSIVDAFAHEDAPALTLTVIPGSTQHSARFYPDGSGGEEAFILCGTQEAPNYLQTDGWRVGTLLMTCEGTRIQDERGNETPAN